METGIPGLSWDELRLKGFKVHELSRSVDEPARTGRRDFYIMGLVDGNITIDHDGHKKEIKGTFLFFVNPKVPHSMVSRVQAKLSLQHKKAFPLIFLLPRRPAKLSPITKHRLHSGEIPM